VAKTCDPAMESTKNPVKIWEKFIFNLFFNEKYLRKDDFFIIAILPHF